MMGSLWRGRARRWIHLIYLIPLAYFLRPVFGTPLDYRFYNLFHSLRPVAPWTEVVVIGIDRDTREDMLTPPVYPLSRHIGMHAVLTENLDRAGTRAIVFDLDLGAYNFSEPPTRLADAFRASGKCYLVMSLEERKRGEASGAALRETVGHLPHPELIAASRGAFVADVPVDPDGYVRRFAGGGARLGRMGLETLPEHLAGFDVSGAIPIEFPSVSRPLPTVSYKEIVAGDGESLSLVKGRVALIGLTEDLSHDFVSVPRIQSVGYGIQAYGLPGVGVLAAITETLLRGAPVRDARWPVALAWNVFWCLLAVSLLWKGRPVLSVLSVLCVLLVALTATGVLHIRGGLVFPAGLLAVSIFLCGVHALVSSYVETAKDLHREEIERERVRHEMDMARATQERFLPDSLPEFEGLDVWGVNISSLAVSGDYYDVLDLAGRGVLVLTIADVSGKGLPASLVMSNVQAGLHSQIHKDRFDLRYAAENLNRLLCENTDSGTFVTLFLAELEKKTHRLQCIRAGHDVPIIISGEGAVRRLEDGGPPLGLVPDHEYTVEVTELGEGEALCLFTDGVTEAMNPDGEQFGVSRLVEMLKARREGTAKELGEAVVRAVRQFSGLEHQADDVTLLIVKAGTTPDP